MSAVRETQRPVAASPVVHARRERVLYFVESYAMLLLLVAIVVFFSLYPSTSEVFPTLGNFQAIVGNQAVVAIVALGALVPIVCGEWDLSIGACAGVSSIFVADVMSSGQSVAVAVAVGLAIGLVVGIFNAVVVTRFGVNGIIATLGTATILAGVTQMKTGGVAIVADIPTSVIEFGSYNWLGIPRVAFPLFGAILLVGYLLVYTPFGRNLYATGSNLEAARLVGLRTRLLVGWSFVVAGVLAGSAGALQVARAGGADPRVGEQFTLPGLAAAFLSAAAIKPGRYNVAGTIVAVFFLAVLNAGLNYAGSPDYFTNYVNGAALLVGVGLATYLGARRKHR